MKKMFSFEFWQKFGKALMVVVAVMPAAGLMISIGKSLPLIDPNLGLLVTTGGEYRLGNYWQLTFTICVSNRWQLGQRSCRWRICSGDFFCFNQPYYWSHFWCNK